jgi:hypothetical protein
MLYKKINLEVIVLADEAEAVIAELNSAVDRLEHGNAIFGGEIEIATFEHTGTRRKTAFMHTVAAGEAAIGAIKVAHGAVAGALRTII